MAVSTFRSPNISPYSPTSVLPERRNDDVLESQLGVQVLPSSNSSSGSRLLTVHCQEKIPQTLLIPLRFGTNAVLSRTSRVSHGDQYRSMPTPAIGQLAARSPESVFRFCRSRTGHARTFANVGADLACSSLGHKLSNLQIALPSEPIHEVTTS